MIQGLKVPKIIAQQINQPDRVNVPRFSCNFIGAVWLSERWANKLNIMIIRSFSLILLIGFLFITNAEGSSSSSPKANSPESIVFQIYRDFAWEAVMAGNLDGLMEQSRSGLERYFDDKLTSLILKDRACAEKEGMYSLDFLPIWSSQDPSARELTIEKTDNQNIIKVKFIYPSTDEKIELLYRVTKTPKGWRISDISGKNWSLLLILTSSK